MPPLFFNNQFRMRRIYVIRFWLRLVVLLAAIFLYLRHPIWYDVALPGQFFSLLSPIHLFWLVWMWDMVGKLLPLGNTLTLGCRKQFSVFYRGETTLSLQLRRQLRRQQYREALLGATLWLIVLAVMVILRISHILHLRLGVLFTIFFYFMDLFCVVLWCPFQKLMDNRCCITCRIFNWDHIMMFTPALFFPSFFNYSLLGASVIVFALWEWQVWLHPEYFSEQTNPALRCQNCQEHLCGRPSAPRC